MLNIPVLLDVYKHNAIDIAEKAKCTIRFLPFFFSSKYNCVINTIDKKLLNAFGLPKIAEYCAFNIGAMKKEIIVTIPKIIVNDSLILVYNSSLSIFPKITTKVGIIKEKIKL